MHTRSFHLRAARLEVEKGEKMNKQEVARDIRECLGVAGFISKNQLSKYLKMDRGRSDDPDKDIMAYLEGLRYIPSGRGPKYFVIDVAERILERSIKQ